MSTYVIQILTGIASGAILFLVASGLTLVFGALRIANFAHGSLYMIGAYLMLSIGDRVGFGNVTFWISLLLAGLAAALIGGVMEVVALRPIYGRANLTQLIVTFGLVLIVTGVVRGIYGPVPRGTQLPPALDGSVEILDRSFPLYQLFLIGLAAAVALFLWVILYRTQLGRTIRAAVSDPELLALSGSNVRWLFTGVFSIGAFLAGLAGAAIASQGAVNIGMDIDVIVRAFIIVVIGGVGSLTGALVGSLLVGTAESLGILWLPSVSFVLVFVLLVLVIAVRPRGLFGREESLTRAASIPIRLPRLSLERFTSTSGRRSRVADRLLWVLAAGGIVIGALAPFILSTANVLIAISALCFALFALSLNLLIGTAGLISFGHALYFGFGAYSVGILITRYGWSPLAALAVTPAIGAAVALVVGPIVLRATALYFALLTLGLAQLGFVVAQGWTDLTGGSNGIHGDFAPGWAFDLDNLYWLVFGCVLFCTALLFIITRSPFGDALRGIRENRRRAEFTGLWLKGYELAALVFAGVFASIAGGLFAVSQGQAYPDLLHWTFSALPVIMALLGGIGYFLGPAAGAFFYTFLNNDLANRTVYWDLIVGLIVLFVALIMPGGLAGAVRGIVALVAAPFERLWTRRPARESAPASRAGTPELRTVTAPHPGPGEGGSSAPILVVEGFSKSFGGLKAVRGVSFQVRRGAMHAIIGPNGAGKTTLFNLITGLLRPDEGRVSLDDHEITGQAPWRVVKRGLGRSFQQTNVFWALSVLDNIVLAEAAGRNATKRVYGRMPAQVRERALGILRRLGLGTLARVPATELSHGDQRSLELAAALAVKSRLLLLDEPTAGLSPRETNASVEMIRQVAEEQGLTVLFIEHDMDVVFGVADVITVLHEGSVLAEGTPDEIRRNPAVRRAYLGEDFAEAATP
jgi:branched-chain amino acid transport system permease protein